MRIEKQKFDATDIFHKLGECKSELPEKYLGFICQLIKENGPLCTISGRTSAMVFPNTK